MRVFRRRSRGPDRLFAMPLVGHIALLLGVAVVLVLVLGFGLWWIIGRPSIPTGRSWTVKDGFDFVKIVLAIVGGIGAVVALVVSYRKQRLGEAAETREDARLFGEDFARATEQLGSEKAPVRLAGMHTLERLAQNTPAQQQTIVNVLCAYLRMPFTPPKAKPAVADREENEHRKHEREVRLTAQRILATNLRPGTTSNSRHWKDIHLDLTGATLIDFDLHDCRLASALFGGAQFSGDASFVGAEFGGEVWFDGAQFSADAWFDKVWIGGDAWFDRVQFGADAWFSGTRFGAESCFTGVHFSGGVRSNKAQFIGCAWFDGAEFGGDARFDEAHFGDEADFEGAEFSGRARFDGARFGGEADFEGVKFSGGARFDEAHFSGEARFEGARVRLDGPGSAWNERTWPHGHALIDPQDPEVARLPGRDGRWGYLTRVDTEDAHPAPAAGSTAVEDQRSCD